MRQRLQAGDATELAGALPIFFLIIFTGLTIENIFKKVCELRHFIP